MNAQSSLLISPFFFTVFSMQEQREAETIAAGNVRKFGVPYCFVCFSYCIKECINTYKVSLKNSIAILKIITAQKQDKK